MSRAAVPATCPSLHPPQEAADPLRVVWPRATALASQWSDSSCMQGQEDSVHLRGGASSEALENAGAHHRKFPEPQGSPAQGLAALPLGLDAGHHFSLTLLGRGIPPSASPSPRSPTEESQVSGEPRASGPLGLSGRDRTLTELLLGVWPRQRARAGAWLLWRCVPDHRKSLPQGCPAGLPEGCVEPPMENSLSGLGAAAWLPAPLATSRVSDKCVGPFRLLSEQLRVRHARG